MIAKSRVEEFARNLTIEANGGIESVLFSPNPFTDGQLLVLIAEQGVFVPDLVSTSYRCMPPKLPIYFLRPSELWQLAIPFGLGMLFSARTGGYEGVSYWFRNEGRVLYGRDVLPEIPIPEDPRLLLQKHLLVSITWHRNHCILKNLVDRKYESLLSALDEKARCLAATAMLVKRVWKIDKETVLDRLGSEMDDPHLAQHVEALQKALVTPSLEDPSARTTSELEEQAYRAAWGFERFVSLLWRYAA